MSDYASNTTWHEMADRLRMAQRIALVTHHKPDGDGLGSVLALGRALPKLGKEADIYLTGPLERALAALIGDTPFRDAEQAPPDDDYDLILIADTGAWSQLEPLRQWLGANHTITVGIDHHPHGDDVAVLRIVDPTAAAAAQMVMTLLDELGCELDGEPGGVAEALYIGLATDTGWFRFENADAAAFEAAARLLRTGVDKGRLHEILEESYHPGRLALESRALASVDYARDGAVAIMSLTAEDLRASDCSIRDLTNIVNRPMIVGPVRVSILLTEIEANVTKASFRSKPARGGQACTDVNVLAQRFGGGGHVSAAGAQLNMDIQAARQAIVAALER